MKKIVCLVGKPNGGKSSIFNRLIKEDKAIIADTPGITRDRLYGNVNYDNYNFILIDTGGIEATGEDNIKTQSLIAVEEADVILFVVDGKKELTKDDYLIRDILRKAHKKVIVVVNKLDNTKVSDNIYNYYELGFEKVLGVSAAHNIGFNSLLGELTEDFKEEVEEELEIPKFCIIGRPNVGKSSLVNALLNESRVVVSESAGTTRDAVDTKFKYNHNDYIIIDTAGMRKKGKIGEDIEKYSLIRSLRAIDRSDVCVIVLSAQDGVIEHDKHITSYALGAGKAVVLCVNKWDALEEKNVKNWQLLIRSEFQFVPYVAIVFLSAKTKKGLGSLMPEVLNAYNNHHKEIKTSLLNKIIENATALHEAPSYKGKRLKIYFAHQEGVKPPKFTFTVNNKGLVHFSYHRYLENQIRENIDLTGTPVILKFKNKGNKDE